MLLLSDIIHITMKKYFLSLLILAACSVSNGQNSSLDLSGEWQFQTDREEVGVARKWYDRAGLDDTILLPGSMPERLKGDDPTLKTPWTGSLYDSSFYFNPALEKYRAAGDIHFPFFLTPSRHYKGVAWYLREVEVPKDWRGSHVTLFLERPHIKTTVYVNGQEIGSQNSLCVPHVYDLTRAIRPGKKNRIAICVDNTMRDAPVGIDSHSVTDQTQGNWNGIVGRMALDATQPIGFEADGDFAPIEVYPNIGEKNARIRIALRNHTGKDQNVQLRLKAVSYNTDRPTEATTRHSATVFASDTAVTVMNVTLDGLTQLWDEFTPTLYRLSAEVLDSKGKTVLAEKEVTFGMREIRIDGKWFYVNGRQTMMRGTVENCDFPLTGYAPMDTASWMRVFRICKEYGLNHMRFHSYCPPEAAFIAADLVGFYLQPEGPSWPNHGVKLGRREPIDTYLLEETRRITREYGNHPSFTMLAAGNEPAGNWVPWASRFVDYWKQKDARRVYTGFSVGGGWAWQPKNEYHVKAGVRGLDWGRMPESMSDFSARIDTVSAPFVCHELGQWCAFPDFKEIDRYTGVYKAKNFEMFRQILADNDMAGMGEKFLQASGKLQALCYKHELEKLLRSRDYAGFQMLAINDYSGQGTALEGILNVFFENKGYITADEWRGFCGTTVPLIRTSKFVYRSDETLKFDIEISHFGAADMKNALVYYLLTDEEGKILRRFIVGQPGDPTYPLTIPIGAQNKVCGFSCDLAKLALEKAQKLTLTVGVRSENGQMPAIEKLTEEGYKNSWEFWVYPAQVTCDEGKVYVTDTLDARALDILQNGGDVLITAAGKVNYGRDIKQYFTPVFWNTSWFKMRPPHTTGIYLDENAPVFRDFPTESYSNLQWWELLNRTQVMLFSDFPKGFQPTVQSIDTWFFSRKIGILFEARVLNGRLMMTTMDISHDLDKRVVARQMRKSILDYMNSGDFRPAYAVDVQQVADLFTKPTPKVDSYTTESPDELKPGYEKKKK